MALTHFGFIYTAPGADPAEHTRVVDTGSCRTVLVGVTTPDQTLPVVEQLVADGVQLIELCGGFGPVGTARVIEAVRGRVPVGSVGYGPESVEQVARIFG